ncbi:MAG: GLPGLI family protein [Flavobacteriaceae bacterium]|nr:GLPGLI family protein [Flavobacteriaceae bacterium]
MKIIYCLLFITSFCYGQRGIKEGVIVVNYNHTLFLEGMPRETSVNAVLIANKSVAAYEMDFLGISNFIDEEDKEEGGIILRIRPNKNPIVFKDLRNGQFFMDERIMSKFYLVKDHIKIFNWSLKDNYKDILGYKCQEATTHYRGRDYRAYFTTKVQLNTGPWKFGGLPGLILSVESIDGVFKMNANTIEIKNVKAEIDNPFVKNIDKAISWDDFIALYKRKYEELLSYTDPDGGYMSIPKKNIETYIKE